MTTMSRPISRPLVAGILLLTALLGGVMWTRQPENAQMWAVTIFMLPAAWGVLTLVKAGHGGWSTDAWRTLHWGLAGAGLLLSLALGLALADSVDLIDGVTSERAMGVVLGGFLVVIGNGMPKALKPLSSAPGCDPAKVQRFQRFAGWTFVLAGLGHAIAWLALPIEWAGEVATVTVLAALLLVAPRLAWFYLTRARAPSPPNG